MLCILVLFSLLQVSSSIINCRISCRRCREKTDHPELMEVYCAMCLECKERRKEWLQGPPSISIRNKVPNSLPSDTDVYDDCCPTLTEDPCEEQPQKLTASLEPYTVTTTRTTTTTTTSTTTSTTHRPCLPKPKCVKPCAVPLLPMMPMCSMCPVNQYQQISAAAVLNDHTKQTSTDSMYLYLGVPKILLNELKLEKKV